MNAPSPFAVPGFAKQPLFKKTRDATATGKKTRLNLSTINPQLSTDLEKMRDYISASGSVDREHLETDNVLGPIYKTFGERLCSLMDELNLTLAA